MAKATLADMVSAAAAAQEPSTIGKLSIAHSAIDPCGLREMNFDMMNMVADGLNNVARHIRPFTLVAWAWRRALRLAEAQARPTHDVLALEDFVSRIEVIFVWSNFLANSNAKLPGGQALAPLISKPEYTFGGPAWQAFDKVRRYSTALSAAVNYGPGLKSLGWVVRNPSNPRVLVPAPGTTAALDAFEALIADRLDHPAFSAFGSVTVTADEARSWSEAWSLGSLTEEERNHAARTLCGDLATPTRSKGIAYLLQAAASVGTTNVASVRSAASGENLDFKPVPEMLETAARWRKLQHRQLFRLSVEALLAWILDRLSDGPRDTVSLADAFMSEAGIDPNLAAEATLLGLADPAAPPSAFSGEISAALGRPLREGLAAAIARGLALSLANAPDDPEPHDRDDRLPLRKAARQAATKGDMPARVLVKHVIETWALAQHVYWAVGRGLQDARRGGKTILRLKVVMDEGGWTALPGRGRLHPNPTADRVETALTLASESGFLP